MKRILVTGACGQVGSELVPALRDRYGPENVLSTDLQHPGGAQEGLFRTLDCTDAAAVERVATDHGTDTVFHLAAILSAKAEKNPQRAYRVNMEGLFNVLEAARKHGSAVFTPSSIAAFGPESPRDPTPQDTLQRPTSIYGVTKVAGELLCDYYHRRHGVDTRGVRYPGLISHVTLPGGGTTDYAVEMFHEALREGRYACFLEAGTQLDMMYMPDAIRAAMTLMEAEADRLEHRNAFNITAMQVTPARLADAIRAHLPHFVIDYEVDPVRQAIADSWPRRLDDSAARREWGWASEWDLEAMTADMLGHLEKRLKLASSSAPSD